MALEEIKNRKVQFGNPYADYEYYGKHSRRTWPSLVIGLLFGIGLSYFAWYRWKELNMVEVMGGTVSLTSIEWLLYKIGGKWVLSGVLFVIGVGLAYAGVSNYKRLEKIKAEA